MKKVILVLLGAVWIGNVVGTSDGPASTPRRTLSVDSSSPASSDPKYLMEYMLPKIGKINLMTEKDLAKLEAAFDNEQDPGVKKIIATAIKYRFNPKTGAAAFGGVYDEMGGIGAAVDNSLLTIFRNEALKPSGLFTTDRGKKRAEALLGKVRELSAVSSGTPVSDATGAGSLTPDTPATAMALPGAHLGEESDAVTGTSAPSTSAAATATGGGRTPPRSRAASAAAAPAVPLVDAAPHAPADAAGVGLAATGTGLSESVTGDPLPRADTSAARSRTGSVAGLPALPQAAPGAGAPPVAEANPPAVGPNLPAGQNPPVIDPLVQLGKDYKNAKAKAIGGAIPAALVAALWTWMLSTKQGRSMLASSKKLFTKKGRQSLSPREKREAIEDAVVLALLTAGGVLGGGYAAAKGYKMYKTSGEMDAIKKSPVPVGAAA